MQFKTLKDYGDLLRGQNLLSEENLHGSENKTVRDISYSSLSVDEGTLFLCKGANFKREYLLDAQRRGAVAYVAEKDMEVPDMPLFTVKDMRKSISVLSSFYFDKSWEKGLKIIGLTGTKGKSTTATMVKEILDLHKGRPVGFSSGIYTYDGKVKEKAKKLTTPETIELHRILYNSVKNKTEYLVMEVSSQGLKYDRVDALDYEICGFLNISEDHISDAEHKDMEDYFTSKLKIFQKSKAACINLDMESEYLDRVLNEAHNRCSKVITFGFSKEADIRGIKVEEKPNALVLTADVLGEIWEIPINIGGVHNSYNALCAIAISNYLGVPMDTVKKGLSQVRVEGRMEHYNIPEENVDIIIDGAHNKMSYEALFDYVREQYPNRKVGFLFGCVGDKAFNRRKEAGEIADKNADFIIITERDPGKEPVENICRDILAHIDHKEKARIIVDRDEAVTYALDKARDLKDTVLLLCGCGSDAYIKRGSKLVEFRTDGERVEEYLNSPDTMI